MPVLAFTAMLRLGLTTAVVAWSAIACTPPSSAISRRPRLADWEHVRRALVDMTESDQRPRLEMEALWVDARARGVPVDKQHEEIIFNRMQAQDAENEATFDQILRDYGWPPRSRVGGDGALIAFLIVQHAPHAKQVVYLPLIREAVAHHEAEAADLALLEDRVNLVEGRKQVYGSQVDIRDGVTLRDVKDPDHLDERRKSVGLGPICEYLAQFVAQGGPVTWPPCVATRKPH
jgi:hypothetical protein